MATEQMNLRFKMVGSTGNRTITFANIRTDVIDESTGEPTTDAKGSITALAQWLEYTTQLDGGSLAVDKAEIVKTEVTEVELE